MAFDKDRWEFWLKVATLIVAFGAFAVAMYSTSLGPKNTLHSERIKLLAKTLDSTGAYGWALGSYARKKDREAFSNDELHAGDPDKIVSLFNQASADLTSLDLILPNDFRPQVQELQALLATTHQSFQNGKFGALEDQFKVYSEKVKQLRERLRAFLLN